MSRTFIMIVVFSAMRRVLTLSPSNMQRTAYSINVRTSSFSFPHQSSFMSDQRWVGRNNSNASSKIKHRMQTKEILGILHMSTSSPGSNVDISGGIFQGDWGEDHPAEEEDLRTPETVSNEHLLNSEGDMIREDEVDPSFQLFQTIRSSIAKVKKAKDKKKQSLLKELENSKSLEGTMKRANLIISNLYQLPSGIERAIVQDWDLDGEEVELVLSDEYNSAQEEADALFAKARKMKRGSFIVETLLIETEEALTLLNDAILDLDAVSDKGGDIDEGRLYLISDRLERSSSKTGFVMKDQKAQPSSPRKTKNNAGKQSTRPQNTFRKFKSPGGCIVLVGRNRRDNESICFQVSRPTDTWMHSRGCPGAHVLVQDRRGGPSPTDECLQFAANLAAFYSDARTERKAPITTASPRHIQKPKGAPLGAVKIREEGNTLIGFPADVDDNLKIAREESGVIWDESGSRSLGGKAKNRKKTKQNSKQESAKRRADKKAKKKRGQRDASGLPDFF
mmetsp:Transcript_6189/g.8845  ORF Transcript_6189/g.8845 Transcript_6189/m.8845 type:complete len:507 (+) Transcript_6189:208-1728(+)